MLAHLNFQPLADESSTEVQDSFERFGQHRFAQEGAVVQFKPLPPMFADLDTNYFVLPSLGSSKLGSSKTYTLVLDLDETLIHSSEDASSFEIRPGMHEFVRRMRALRYEIVVFTSATQDYAEKIIDKIDPEGLIQYRLYRQHAVPWGSLFLKDLSRLGRDLSRTVIIDDISDNFGMQPQNGIAITAWRGDNPQDQALQNLTPLLEELISSHARVQDILSKYKAQIPGWVSGNHQQNGNANRNQPNNHQQQNSNNSMAQRNQRGSNQATYVPPYQQFQQNPGYQQDQQQQQQQQQSNRMPMNGGFAQMQPMNGGFAQMQQWPNNGQMQGSGPNGQHMVPMMMMVPVPCGPQNGQGYGQWAPQQQGQ